MYIYKIENKYKKSQKRMKVKQYDILMFVDVENTAQFFVLQMPSLGKLTNFHHALLTR